MYVVEYIVDETTSENIKGSNSKNKAIIAAIVIPIIFAAVLIAVIVFFFYRRFFLPFFQFFIASQEENLFLKLKYKKYLLNRENLLFLDMDPRFKT